MMSALRQRLQCDYKQLCCLPPLSDWLPTAGDSLTDSAGDENLSPNVMFSIELILLCWSSQLVCPLNCGSCDGTESSAAHSWILERLNQSGESSSFGFSCYTPTQDTLICLLTLKSYRQTQNIGFKYTN